MRTHLKNKGVDQIILHTILCFHPSIHSPDTSWHLLQARSVQGIGDAEQTTPSFKGPGVFWKTTGCAQRWGARVVMQWGLCTRSPSHAGVTEAACRVFREVPFEPCFQGEARGLTICTRIFLKGQHLRCQALLRRTQEQRQKWNVSLMS